MSRIKDLAGSLLGRERGNAGKDALRINPGDISIGITTFEHRFDRYFAPLLDRIRKYAENEIVVAVNAKNKGEFIKVLEKRMVDMTGS